MSLWAWLSEPLRELAGEQERDRKRHRHGLLASGTAGAIGPDVFESLERQRLAALEHRRRTWWFGSVLTAMFGSATAYGMVFPHSYEVLPALATGLAATGTVSLSKLGFERLQRYAKERVLRVLAAQAGMVFDPDGVDSDVVRRFREHGLFGGYLASFYSEDAFLGTIDGVSFQLFEAGRFIASAESKGKANRSSCSFQGLALCLSLPKRFAGTTRIVSEHDFQPRDGLERVRLEDPRFEKHFEAFSSDQVEARYLLTPTFMERLLRVQRVLGRRTKLRGVFADSELLLTFDTRDDQPLWSRILRKRSNHFDISEPWLPVEASALLERLREELASCMALVRALEFDRRTRI